MKHYTDYGFGEAHFNKLKKTINKRCIVCDKLLPFMARRKKFCSDRCRDIKSGRIKK